MWLALTNQMRTEVIRVEALGVITVSFEKCHNLSYKILCDLAPASFLAISSLCSLPGALLSTHTSFLLFLEQIHS